MDGYVTIGTKLDTQSFDAQIDYVEQQMQDIEDKLKQADMGYEVGDTAKLEAQYEKLSVKLSTLKTKQLELNKTDFSNVEKSISSVGDKMTSTIKKVGRWALAVFGIRSAYLAVRKAVSTLSQYNDKLKDDLEYINFAVASAFQPIIEGLISLVYKLLNYVNYIAKAWFGVNLFANASAKAMNNSAKSAEKMKKSMAGFDEMNTLNGNNGNEIIPSVDLSKWQGEVPSWIQWIADNKETVIAGLLGIAGGLTAIGIGFKIIQGLGIGLLFAGIITIIQGLISYLNDPSWENFGKIIFGIGIILTGLGVILGGIPLIVAGILTTITGLVLKNWNTIQGYLNSALKFIEGILDWIDNNFGILGEIITNPFRIAITTIKVLFQGLFTSIKNIFDGILYIFKGDFKNGFISIAKGLLNAIITILNVFINGVNHILTPIRLLISAAGKILNKNWTMDDIKIPTISYLKSGGIVNYPNKGVSVGKAMAGESGAEGVIPLTDSQAMEQLGSAIGQYITANFIIPVNIDGKKIDRQMGKIRANNNFALNR